MRRKPAACALLLVLALLLSACASERPAEPEDALSLYYVAAEGSETAQAGTLASQLCAAPDRASIDAVLELWLRGPTDAGLRNPLPASLSCSGYALQSGALELRFEGAAAPSALERTLLCACLTLTLTQLPEVSSVALQLPEKTPGENTGPFCAEDFLLYDAASELPEYTVSLYFPDRQGLLHEEKRAVACADTTLLPQLAVQELIKGPTASNLVQILPKDVELLDFSAADGGAILIFSEDFVRCDSSARAAQNAVRSITATLCAFEDITAVQLALTGDLSMENIDLDRVFSPGPGWYAK